jgi:type II secretory pathway component PulF
MFIASGIILLMISYVIAPRFAYIFNGIPYKLPTLMMLKKDLQFDVFCMVFVGTLIWITTEIQIRKKADKETE